MVSTTTGAWLHCQELVLLDQQAQIVRADLSACFAALHFQVLSQFLNGQLTLEQALTALKLRMKVGYEGMRTSACTWEYPRTAARLLQLGRRLPAAYSM